MLSCCFVLLHDCFAPRCFYLSSQVPSSWQGESSLFAQRQIIHGAGSRAFLHLLVVWQPLEHDLSCWIWTLWGLKKLSTTGKIFIIHGRSTELCFRSPRRGSGVSVWTKIMPKQNLLSSLSWQKNWTVTVMVWANHESSLNLQTRPTRSDIFTPH